MSVTLFGLALTIGFGYDLLFGNIFARLIVYQRWPMGTGVDWYFHQCWMGLIASLVLALLGAIEMQRRFNAQAASSRYNVGDNRLT